jgi:hypothetical protein
VDDRLVGEGDRVLQAQGREDPLAQGVLERRPEEHLDDATQQREAAVAVAPDQPGGSDLRQVGAPGDVPREGVVAPPGVGEVVAVEAAGVGEQVAGRDRVAGVVVGDLEVRQVGPDRDVQVEPALVDQHHHQRRGVELADRAGQEERVGGRRLLRAQAQDAGGDLGDGVAVEDGQLGAGDVVLLDQLGELLLELLGREHRVSLIAGPTV